MLWAFGKREAPSANQRMKLTGAAILVSRYEDLAGGPGSLSLSLAAWVTSMDPSWKHADVFPIIARVIEQAYREHQRFITAQEIATRLLQDSEGRNLVEAARELQQEQQSLEWLASNMVSWFSQRITVGDSDWVRAFERKKADGVWAYKPLAQPVGEDPDGETV